MTRRGYLDDNAMTTRPAGRATTNGVPAPGRQPFGGRRSGAGAFLIALALAACTDRTEPEPPTTPAPLGDRVAADPAEGMQTELDSPAPELESAMLAELTGDEDGARKRFQKVLDAPDSTAPLAARAALHLAQLDARAGRSASARDLALRASALAPNDPVIYEGAAQVRASTDADGATDLRGPPLGTPLTGAPAGVAKAFAQAEVAFGKVHRYRPRPSIETLTSSIRGKEDSTEPVVAQYLAVAESSGLAYVAAHYRAGSLYRELALALTFELPPELDQNVAAGLRRTLRDRARGYLKKAVAEYKLAIDANAVPESEQWRVSAQDDLRSAQDLLGEAR